MTKALKAVRKHGFVCTIPLPTTNDRKWPRGADEDKPKKSTTEQEALQDCEGTTFEVKNQERTTIVMLLTCCYYRHGYKREDSKRPWLVLRCLEEEKEHDAVLGELHSCFKMSNQIKDQQQQILREHEGMIIQLRTGMELGKDGSLRQRTLPRTLFTMRSGDKVFAKALCTYDHSDFDIGPTIQLFEVAAEWRGHGHGQNLFLEMERHFQSSLFSGLEYTPIELYVQYVCRDSATAFFEKRGFTAVDEEEMYRDLFDESFHDNYSEF
jgi:GNAT superfamily N-acetyltransferase